MIGGRSPRRLVSTALFVGAASAALASAGPDALLPFRDVAGAATDVSVAFVIDLGGSAGVVVKCATVPSGDSGLQALFAVAAPRLPADGSPFVCAINGVPTTGCGQIVSGGDIYWSYWHGTSGGWQYSNLGSGSTQVQNGDVEGWRFQNPGNGNPTDPPPRSSADYAANCGPLPPDPTATPAAPTTAPVAAPGAVAPGSSSSPSGGTGSKQPGSQAGSNGSSASTTTTPVPSSSPTTGPQAPVGTGPRGSSATPNAGPQAQSLRTSPSASRQAGGTGVVPALVGGLIVVALVVGTLLRWRKRSHSQ